MSIGIAPASSKAKSIFSVCKEYGNFRWITEQHWAFEVVNMPLFKAELQIEIPILRMILAFFYILIFYKSVNQYSLAAVCIENVERNWDIK